IVALRPSGGALSHARLKPSSHARLKPSRYIVEEEWRGMNVKGPMARSVADCAFLFSVMVREHDEALALSLSKGLERDMKDVSIAWCPDLGGLPLDSRV